MYGVLHLAWPKMAKNHFTCDVDSAERLLSDLQSYELTNSLVPTTFSSPRPHGYAFSKNPLFFLNTGPIYYWINPAWIHSNLLLQISTQRILGTESSHCASALPHPAYCCFGHPPNLRCLEENLRRSMIYYWLLVPHCLHHDFLPAKLCLSDFRDLLWAVHNSIGPLEPWNVLEHWKLKCSDYPKRVQRGMWSIVVEYVPTPLGINY